MAIRVAFISLGCAKNLVDTERMAALVVKDGMEIVETYDDADAIVVNTCGFIESAKAEAIEQIIEINDLRKTGNLKAIVAAGCLTERYKTEFLDDIPEVDAVLGTGSYDKIVDAIKSALVSSGYRDFSPVGEYALEGERLTITPPYYAYLKIAEGCDNRCAYCVIPSLRGPFRSRRMEDLISEAEGLAKSGVKELIVIAQDTTRYGTDIYGEQRLPALLKALCAIPGFSWIRLHYLYPDEITDELLETIRAEDKILKYFDIPIQHISNKILKSMNRRGDGDSIRALFAKIRHMMPGAVLRSSVIVGLPGEGDAEFTELCDFLREAKIERLGVFSFTPQEGTAAAQMEDQVSDEVKARREEILSEIQYAGAESYAQSLLGSTISVLTEGYDRVLGCYFGRGHADSPEIDAKIFFTSEKKHLPGDFTTVTVCEIIDGEVFGQTK